MIVKYTKQLFIAGFTLLISGAGAQTIPMSAFPTAGQTFSLTKADTTGVQPGAGGASMTWNFGTLTAGIGVQRDSFLAPSATPYGHLFPAATIAVHEIAPPSTNYFIYYQNDAANSIYKRIANVQPDTVIYSDQANEYPYPLAYNNTYHDTYYAHYHSGSGFSTMAGSVTGTADGYGTLILPTGTYNNTLRFHATRNELDTVIVSGNLIPVTQVLEYYVWYQPDSYFPIFSISTISIHSAFINRYSKSVGYRVGYPSSSGLDDIDAAAAHVMVYPNPASQSAMLLFDAAQGEESSITIYDVTGRAVYTQSHIGGQGLQQTSVNTLEIPSGIYEVKVVNSQNTSSVKLQIVK